MTEPDLVSVEAPTRSRLGLASLHGFRHDVQALRGVAVLLVVLYHAQLWVPGGFVGVDVFFVISGFVIGRRLVARFAGPRGGVMGEFYLHRARRILPAMGMLLVVVILLSPLLAPIGGAKEVGPTGVAAALFSANAYLYRASDVGYFDSAAELNPLLHTWSLSVEEQFYFLIPVLLLVAWMVGRRRWGSLRMLRVLVAVLFASSLALCVWLSYAQDVPRGLDGLRLAFFSPFTRAWEFAAGLALVLIPVRFLSGVRWQPALVASGVVMIGVAAFAYSDSTVFPGYAALLPVLGTALVIHAGAREKPGPESPTTRSALRPLTWTGDLSYSWYLWHWPVIVFAGAFWPQSGVLPLAVAAALSLIPAWLSYEVLERNLRATSTTRVRPTVVLAVCCIVVPLAAAGLTWPVRSLVDQQAADRLVVEDAFPDQAGELRCNSLVPRGQRPPEICTWGDVNASSSVVLLGDSTAAHLSNALIGAAEANDARLEIVTRGGCPLADLAFEWPAGEVKENQPAECVRFIEESMSALEADPPDVVVLSNASDNWVFGDGFLPIDPTTGRPASSRAERARLYEQALTRLVERLRAAGIRVALVDSLPKPYSQGYSFELQDCSKLAVIVDVSRCLSPVFTVDLGQVSHSADQEAKANTLNRRVARRTDAVRWSFAADVCPGGRCEPVRDGRLVWRDGAHLSGAMSQALVPTTTEYLRRTLEAARNESDDEVR